MLLEWPAGRHTKGKRLRYFVIGRLDDHDFVSRLGEYVRAVIAYKNGDDENYFRNTIIDGVNEAIQTLQDHQGVSAADVDTPPGVAKTRLTRFTELGAWLQDDPDMLQSIVESFTIKDRQDKQRRLALAIVSTGISIMVGWLLSAVSPAWIIGHLLGH